MKSSLLQALSLLLLFSQGAYGFASSKIQNVPSASKTIRHKNRHANRLSSTTQKRESLARLCLSSSRDTNSDGMSLEVVLHRHKGSLTAEVPEGMRLVSVAEAEAMRIFLVYFLLSEWDIARLAGDCKIDGRGYGGIIQKEDKGGEILGCCLITPMLLSREQKFVQGLEEAYRMESAHEEELNAWQ